MKCKDFTFTLQRRGRRGRTEWGIRKEQRRGKRENGEGKGGRERMKNEGELKITNQNFHC